MSGGERREDIIMDKKSRLSSLSQKGNGQENKKGLDGNGNGGPKFRQNWRRESQNQNVPKTEPQRRPQSQKWRSMDKRPRSRGNFSGGNRDEMTPKEPEYGSVQAWGSKKSNLNHLLNFHFEGRESGQRGRGSGWKPSGPRRTGHKAAKYNKEQFLQANCQFVVREDGDYSIHATDPDRLVDWDLIQQVRITSSEQPSCPICLYPPTAAKVTRCGHIYCWACILHYLSLSDKTWRRCPICYEAVHKTDLKSVAIIKSQDYHVGEEITMSLMRRQKGSMVALPIDCWSPAEGLPNMTDGNSQTHTKLLMATPDQVDEIQSAEQTALETQLQMEGEHTLEGSYVKAALDMLQECCQPPASEKVSDELKQLQLQDSALAQSPSEPIIGKNTPREPMVDYISAFSDEEVDQTETVAVETGLPRVQTWCDGELTMATDQLPLPRVQSWTAPGCADDKAMEAAVDSEGIQMSGYGGSSLDLEEEEDRTSEDCKESDTLDNPAMGPPAAEGATGHSEQKLGEGAPDSFYFYQASDGQLVFIHSVNARSLIHEYGCLAKGPTSLTAQIVEIQQVTMTEELRRRLRYLSHLPLTCEFKVVELDLKPPVISNNTLRQFTDEIERRKKMRQRRLRDERRIARRIQEQERREMGVDPSRVIVRSGAPEYIQTVMSEQNTIAAVTSIPENRETPTTMESGLPSSPTGSVASSESLGTSPVTVTEDQDDGGVSSPMSFAQMLRSGKARPQDKSSWPKTGEASAAAEAPSRAQDGGESDGEGGVAVPGYQASFGDAIQEALDNYMKKPDEPVAVEVVKSGGSGKKKKKPIKLLFTTNINRSK